jgi:hypothetical protein
MFRTSKTRTLLESLATKRAAQESGLTKAEQDKLQFDFFKKLVVPLCRGNSGSDFFDIDAQLKLS